LNFIQNIKENQGPVEHDPEYLLIVDANNLLVEIDIIQNFVKNIYHKRFPELEQLVQLPMDYLKTVKVCYLYLYFLQLKFFFFLGIRQ